GGARCGRFDAVCLRAELMAAPVLSAVKHGAGGYVLAVLVAVVITSPNYYGGEWNEPTRPSKSVYLLSHLGSWGVVLSATENKKTGLGSDVLSAANYLVQQSSNASRVLLEVTSGRGHVVALGSWR